ncbi:MAG TPA: aconitate hydratase AcnA, partial [Ktedonobacterales bacterium]
MSSAQSRRDSFGARASLTTQSGEVALYRLDALASGLNVQLDRLPFTLRVLAENALRQHDLAPDLVSEADVRALAGWRPGARPAPGEPEELPFLPARVIMQDFTGVPAVVDLAAMRDAVKELGGDPNGVNPLVPADLVIDHSVQVDSFGTTLAFRANVTREYERNGERYALLRWAQQAFKDFSVVPPGTGIVHQVNLEYLAKVVQTRDGVAFPDTLVGTDSHTTMINGLGVLGWGVGGIEAEAVLLGQPLYLLTPEVVGIHLMGALPEGATATDLVLMVTQMLRKHGVVGRFVEFAGSGLSSLALADRATISNMSPEFGATATFFPVDDETLRYMRLTGRDAALVDLVERYTKAQGMFRTDKTPTPEFNELLELDLATIEPSMAGPRRPQDRVALGGVGQNFRSSFKERYESGEGGAAVAVKAPEVTVDMNGEEVALTHGSVAIAAITSCTNTSNPSVMIGAGLLAKHAVERGLRVSPAVKTSLAPGSRAVTDYLEAAGLIPFLEALRFHVVGYGCTTCIAEGTPVTLANGVSAPIERMPLLGGARMFAPTADGRLGIAAQTEKMDQGVRECISLVLEDGRKLVCTPDHKILLADGRWVRADELKLNEDRIVVGLETPLDEPSADEDGYTLQVGTLTFSMATPL